jgi:hypothetical protein
MKKYGILEKGMELQDVVAYAADTMFARPEQVFALRITEPELNMRMGAGFVKSHLLLETNIFRLVKGRRLKAAALRTRSISGRLVEAARRRARRVLDFVK